MDDTGGIAQRIADVIGDELALDLLRLRGGTEITIPKRIEGSWLARTIGEDAANLLLIEFGPANLTLPMGEGRGARARRRRAKKMLAEGASARDVALACGIHTRTVHKYRAELRDEDQLSFPFDDDSADP